MSDVQQPAGWCEDPNLEDDDRRFDDDDGPDPDEAYDRKREAERWPEDGHVSEALMIGILLAIAACLLAISIGTDVWMHHEPAPFDYHDRVTALEHRQDVSEARLSVLENR